MDGQLIQLDILPTKGIKYPDDIEIYVKPLTIKEQIDMDRYGISQAEYYQKVLDGVTIKGFYNKQDLFFCDIQFIDLVRRLYTFDLKEEIQAKEYPCRYCDGTVDYSFTFDQISFTELKEEVFNKEYEFSDGLKIVTGPITIKEFIEMSRKYLSKTSISQSDVYIAYFIACIKEVQDREFADKSARDKFMFDYIADIYKNKDKKILDEIEENTVSVVEPFQVLCPKCGETTEVEVTPSMRFHQ